jgi:phosphatidylinositol glycan class W
LVGANKEGIVSLTGYLAIHLLGLSAGTIILPPTPSFFRRRQQAIASRKAPSQDLDPRAPRQLGKTATELCSYAILWWTLLGVSKLAKVDREWGPDGGVSRRMANLPYVFWVAAYNISFTLAYILILDLFFFPGPKPRKIPGHLKSPTVDYGQGHFQQAPAEVEGNPPELLEAINKHGLALFLVVGGLILSCHTPVTLSLQANVLTGLINLSMKTMYMSDAASMIVLSAYSMVVSAVAWFWNRFDNSKKQR